MHDLLGPSNNPATMHFPYLWHFLHSSSRKTMKTVWFRDPMSKAINNTMPKRPSLSKTKQPLPAPKASKSYPPSTKQRSALKLVKPKLTKTFPSTAAAQVIVTLKQAFPSSFNTIGTMSRMYTIRTDPSIPPGQHIQRKVPIEYQQQIKCTLTTWSTRVV